MALRLYIILGLVFVAGCGSISVPDVANGPGAACTAASDCQEGLVCTSNTCIDPTKGEQGANCTKTADCQVSLQCMNGTCVDSTGAGDTCPDDCVSSKCCYLRTSLADDPEVACSTCSSEAQCNPQATGFKAEDICDNCSPTFVDKINAQSISKGQEVFQTCYCEGSTGDSTFDTCVTDNLPINSNKACNTCFLHYYDCLRDACPACDLDQGPFCSDFWTPKCADCSKNTSCQDDLFQCTGGVDWIPES